MTFLEGDEYEVNGTKDNAYYSYLIDGKEVRGVTRVGMNPMDDGYRFAKVEELIEAFVSHKGLFLGKTLSSVFVKEGNSENYEIVDVNVNCENDMKPNATTKTETDEVTQARGGKSDGMERNSCLLKFVDSINDNIRFCEEDLKNKKSYYEKMTDSPMEFSKEDIINAEGVIREAQIKLTQANTTSRDAIIAFAIANADKLTYEDCYTEYDDYGTINFAYNHEISGYIKTLPLEFENVTFGAYDLRYFDPYSEEDIIKFETDYVEHVYEDAVNEFGEKYISYSVRIHYKGYQSERDSGGHEIDGEVELRFLPLGIVKYTILKDPNHWQDNENIVGFAKLKLKTH